MRSKSFSNRSSAPAGMNDWNTDRRHENETLSKPDKTVQNRCDVTFAMDLTHSRMASGLSVPNRYKRSASEYSSNVWSYLKKETWILSGPTEEQGDSP